MPTPLDLLLDPISLVILGLYAALWAAETFWPGRKLPHVPGSHARGLAWYLLYFFGSSYLPYLWADFVAPYRLVDLTGWSTPLGILAGVLSYELVGYFYHRLIHRSDFLFRVLHQMHHSAERLDVPSAFYFHPLDIIGWTMVTSLGLSVLVGLSPAATGGAVLFVTFLSIFQHANIKTPRWLGYLVQRPESHSRHHENPADFAPHTGYFDGASAEVGPLLLCRDVAASSGTTAQRFRSRRASYT
jgi:sterol desaturase/sphingolipid hydroxylase (fatty acid hydroxylase superfamily)